MWTCTFHTKPVDTRKDRASLWLISADVSSRSCDAAKKVKFDPPGTETWSSLYEIFEEVMAVIYPTGKELRLPHVVWTDVAVLFHAVSRHERGTACQSVVPHLMNPQLVEDGMVVALR